MLTALQKLWYVPNTNTLGAGCVTVLTVGRKWATISDRPRTKIDVNTLIPDQRTWTTCERCYLSEQAHQEDMRLRRLYNELAMRIPPHLGQTHTMTEDTIRTVARLLDIPLPTI